MDNQDSTKDLSSPMADSKGYRVAIVGATGYGGLQSLRLLMDHPKMKITFLGGDRSSGKYWNELTPYMSLNQDIKIEKVSAEAISEKSDFAILSLPNGLASQLAPDLLDKGIRVIDLSADYRFHSLQTWKDIYKSESEKYLRDDSQLCEQAVYGLPEWYQKEISKANLVGSPGCFPTASLLPLLPFLNQGLVENDGIIIDAKSGTSGGGRTEKVHLLLAEASETIQPYSVIGHRHTSEIEMISSKIAGHNIQLQFTPHLVPMVRGILVTLYARLRDPGLTGEDCKTVLESFYRNQKTIGILPVGLYPSTKWVRNTNKALISCQVDKRNGRIILMSVIDNLIKGQAGQAIQSLNIMSGLDPCLGLPLNSFYP